MVMQVVHKQEGAPESPARMLAIIDFNVPNARDSLKLPQTAAAVATIFKTIGVDRCVVLAHMAAYPKEDTDKDPLDDEMDIKNVFKKAGVETQQRVRMLLSQPPQHRIHPPGWRWARQQPLDVLGT